MSLFARIRSFITGLMNEADQELAEQSAPIVHTTDTCFGRARLANTRMPVWVLESMRRGGHKMNVVLESYPHLTEEQVHTAWSYADAHEAEISSDIREQAEFDFGIDLQRSR